MRYLVFILSIFSINLFALSQFQSSQVCKKCHPVIYKEHYSSQHRKASIYNDDIHKSIWDKHPLKKKELYKCAKCHTPNDKKLITALKDGKKAIPLDNKAQQEGVSCVSCHNIKSIKHGAKSNTNIITTDKKVLYSARESEKNQKDKKYKTKTSFFGFVSEKSGSPFHDIDFSNELYYNGDVCMGCHSHKENSKKFKVCEMDIKDGTNNEQENCITCHMPKVEGSFSTITKSKTHRYHGFTGSIHKPKMLSKYVDIEYKKDVEGFDITVVNHANHPLFLHPLRLAELRVYIIRDKKRIDLNPVKFARVIGKDTKPSPPWLATEVIKDTQIKAKESRVLHFHNCLKTNDELVVTLGYFINKKNQKDFIHLKQEIFDVR